MHKLNKICVKGFRRLQNNDITMRPMTVLIGENGVGKSSFLDVMSLLSASAAGRLNKTLSDLGGITEASTRGKDKIISLDAEMDCPGYEPLKYHLEIMAKGQTYDISDERLTQQRVGNYDEPFKHIDSSLGDIKYYNIDDGKLVRPDWEHSPLESSLSQVPKLFRQPEEFRRVLSSVTKYHVLDVTPRAPIKLPQQMKPALLPGADGEDLIPFLYNLRESNRDRYEVIEDALRSGFPGFEGLYFPPSAAGMLSLTWKDKHFRDPIFAHQLSEGTLRFLWLVALLQSPDLSTVTMIDEPEVSLHPELLNLLADLLREAAKKTQIIVATHSDRLIRFLEPEEVLVMDIDDDGYATTQWADEMDIDRWLVDYSLDDVWRMGRLGGRP